MTAPAGGAPVQLTTTAEPNPTLLEGFDPNLLSLSLAINPQVGGSKGRCALVLGVEAWSAD